jgi:hypothetical protein
VVAFRTKPLLGKGRLFFWVWTELACEIPIQTLEPNSYAGMQKGGWHTNYWEEGRRTKEEKSLAEQEVRRTCTQSREINKKKLD